MDCRARVFVLAAALAACLAQPAAGRFVIEKGGLKIKFPAAAAAQHPEGFDMSLGNFGSPVYGGTLTGKLAYVDAAHGHDNRCSPECRFACQPFNASSPPLAFDRGAATILLVDRGPSNAAVPACKFTEKVWNAQQAGAAAVVVVNYEEAHTTMDAPDEEDDDKDFRALSQLTIPAAFVTRSAGDALKALLEPGREEAFVTLDWTDVLPRASVVRWQFWSGSNDMCGPKCAIQQEFVKQFSPAARELEEGHWTAFEPHYLVHACPAAYVNTEECKSQCIHHGRYCAPDPDGSITEGYSGREVVQENLRQLCVFKLGNATGRPFLWWEYVTRFAAECAMSAQQYGQACAERVFAEVGGERWASLAAFRQCAGETGEDRTNDILEAELRSQRGSGDVGEVYILPTVRINDGQYRGRLAYKDVLRAICAGFSAGAQPDACLRITTDACRPGGPADAACRSNPDGRTQCLNSFEGYTCGCGACYEEAADAGGQAVCRLKCKGCDAATGACPGAGGLSSLWAAALALLAAGVAAAAGFGAYRWRVRREMRDEVQQILRQYLPLDGDDRAEPRAQRPADVERA